MYKATFYTYSGMPIPLTDKPVSRDEAIEILRRHKRRAEKYGQPVTKIGVGEWEFETPENAFMVSDMDGVLKFRKCRG